jgi:hypothetical protein
MATGASTSTSTWTDRDQNCCTGPAAALLALESTASSTSRVFSVKVTEDSRCSASSRHRLRGITHTLATTVPRRTSSVLGSKRDRVRVTARRTGTRPRPSVSPAGMARKPRDGDVPATVRDTFERGESYSNPYGNGLRTRANRGGRRCTSRT